LKNKTITVTSTAINTEETQIYNATRVLTSTGMYDLPASPQRIYFTNTSGQAFQFNVLTKEELREFMLSSTGFVGIEVANNGVFRHHEIYGKEALEDVYYVTVKGTGTGASSDVTIYLLDYI